MLPQFPPRRDLPLTQAAVQHAARRLRGLADDLEAATPERRGVVLAALLGLARGLLRRHRLEHDDAR